jgi:hypothetical protein
VVIIGRKGSGKSTMLADSLKTAKRLIVFDPLGERSGNKDWLPNQIGSLSERESVFRNRRGSPYLFAIVSSRIAPDFF